MLPSPGALQHSLPRPARAQQSHSPDLLFLRWVTFSSDLNTPPCPVPEKRAFSPDSLARQPRREWGKSPQAHLKGKEKTCPAETLHSRRLAPVTGAAMSTQAAPPRPPESLCGCPSPCHPRARPDPCRRSSPAAPLSPPLHHPSRHGRLASRLGNTTLRNHCLTLPPASVTSPRKRSPFRSQRRKSSFFPLKEPRSDPWPCQHEAPARGLRHAELFGWDALFPPDAFSEAARRRPAGEFRVRCRERRYRGDGNGNGSGNGSGNRNGAGCRCPGTTGGLGAWGSRERQRLCGRGEGAGLSCRGPPGTSFLGWGFSGGTGESRVFAESLGLEGPSGYPGQPSARVGPPRAGYTVAHPGEFWMSPDRETPRLH